MAKFAPVVPIQIAEQLQGDKIADDLFGGYHLILAHDVLARPEDYARVYGRVKERFLDSFIILDNSIVELGKAMEIDDLLHAAAIVQPDCIVAPDVMGDGEGTRSLTRKFSDDYHHATKHQRSPIPLMGVLQGATLEDCIHTYTLYSSLVNLALVSVPRIIVKQHGSRMPLLTELTRRWSFRNIHMLGFSDDLLDDVACARMEIVKGIDSAVPIRAGLQGLDVILSEIMDYGPRGDYWEYETHRITTLKAMCITGNIRKIRRWIQPTIVMHEHAVDAL